MKLLIIWALVALTAVHARTAVRQQPISPRITSLTDKDARQKARVHPAFASAGTRAGLELWRIENFEPVAVPAGDVGKFYKGDSYVVLKTTADKRNNLSWDIHYWIGSESSQDESGAAAILTVGLDDKFDGKAVQHRETMGYESKQFLNYFPGGAVRYLDGGHQSGFNHVVTNPGAEKRLFQVKGKKNIRVRQVDPLISSMNKGDCFILDINSDIFLYVGEKSKNVERLKAISMANQIRDQDHNGRGRVEIIDQYSSEVDVQKFFTNLGSGSRDLVPEESAGGDDQTFEKSEESSVILSEVSDSSGKLKITPLPAPFRQEQLKPQETYILDTVSGSIYVWVGKQATQKEKTEAMAKAEQYLTAKNYPSWETYILDTVSGSIYVWVGKQATQKEKTEAMAKAEQYLTAKNYPSWVHVARIPQGTEPAIFKQYFSTWRDAGMSHSRIVRSADDDSYEDSVETPRPPTEPYTLNTMTMNSEGDYMRYMKIRNFSQKDLKEDKIYFLVDSNSGDSYYWIGRLVPNPEATINALNRFIHVLSAGGRYFKIYKQGEEGPRFVRAFPDWDDRMWQKQEMLYHRMAATEEMRYNLIPDSS